MERAELRARLIEAGLLPDLIDAALDAAEQANDELPTMLDVLEDSEVTEEDKARARQFWLYTDDVPDDFKRLLAAVKRI